MAANNFHELPNPHSSVSGSNLEDKGNQKPSKVAEKWRPRGAPVTEPKVATIARFANYLIDRITGKAYSADELLSRPVAAADITDPENIVTKSLVNSAIAEDPAAVRAAMEIPSPLPFEKIALDSRVAAYASRARLTSATKIRRLNEFVIGAELLGCTIIDGVFLGTGLNSAAPITFIGLAANSNTPASTHSVVAHGELNSTNAELYKFPTVSAVGDDMTMVAWFAGCGVVEAGALVRLEKSASTFERIGFEVPNTSGSANVTVYKDSGPAASTSLTFADFYTEPAKQFAVQWEDGVGAKNSLNGAAWSAQAAYAASLAGRLDRLWVGKNKGVYSGCLIFSGLLTDAQIAAVYKLAKRTIFSSDLKLVTEGDSIIEATSNWPGLALRAGGWAGAVLGYSAIGAGGNTAKDVYDQAVAGSFSSHRPTAAIPYSWLIIQAGHNDLANYDGSGDYTNAKVLFHISETARIAKEAGFEKVIVCTVMKGSGINSRGRLSDVDAINAELRDGNVEHVDAVVDADAAMGAASAVANYWTDTTYFSDGVHPNAAGKQVLANNLNATVAALPPRASESH